MIAILGSRVKDRFTGFTGIAVGRTDWMFGCTRFCVESTELKDGKPVEQQWFDEQRLMVVDQEYVPAGKTVPPSGGPQHDPVRGHNQA